MKNKLIILSLVPAFILILLNNLEFGLMSAEGVYFNSNEFFKNNICVLILIVICILWILISMGIWIEFKFFLTYDVQGGYQVQKVNEDKEAGLNFFLTLIIPLMIDNLNTWHCLIAFLLIIFGVFRLLSKTDLFYANPILTILGYKVYKFEFKDNENYVGVCICITKSILADNVTVRYKQIDGNVLFIK